MSPDDYLRLVGAGLNAEQIALVMEMMTRDAKERAEAEEERKAKGRERWHRWKDKQQTNVSQREPMLANGSREGDARGEDNLLPKKISGKEGNKEESAPVARPDLQAFKSELSSILDTERIEALVAVRRKKGATMTPHAGRLLAKALSACPNVAEAADEMVLRNWTGVKPEWLERQRSTATAPPAIVKPSGVVAAYQRMMERDANGRTDAARDEDAERLPGDNRQLRLIAGHISAAARGPV